MSSSMPLQATVDPRRSLSVVASALLVATYPVLAWLGLLYLGPRTVALVLGGLMVTRLLAGLGGRGREHARVLAVQLLPLALVVAPTLFLDDPRYLQALPVLINAMLLFAFARSLSGPVSIVERFARVQDPDLTEEEIRYCRAVTRVWCGFFVANGGIATLLIFTGSVASWALYTGFVSYLLIGALFAGEWIVRRLRFRRFGDGAIDQLALALIGPGEPRADRPAPRNASSDLGTAWASATEKGSVLAIRTVFWVCTRLGRRAVRLLMRGVALYYVAVDADLRRASRRYHRRLGVPADLGAIYRHVRRFAYSASDRVFLLRRDLHLFELRRTGREHVDRLQAEGRGAILLGAHFGSFEALRVSADDDAFPLSIVAWFENARKSSAILEAIDPAFADRVIQVEPGSMSHVLRIRDRVRNGELVGMLGDRLLPGTTGIEVDFLGAPAVFPTGAFEVAAVLGCPVLLAFCIGRDPNVYEIHCEVLAERVDLPREGRRTALAELVARYAKRLEAYVRIAPDNWFNFYDFWAEGGAAPGRGAQSEPPK